MSEIASRNRQVMLAVVLTAGYALNLWATNVLREGAAGIDTIWTANAFVIGAMILLPKRWRIGCLAVGFVVQTAIILLFGHSLFDAVGYSLLNVVEAIAVVALAGRLGATRITAPGRFATLLFGALAPVLVIITGLLGLVVLGMTGEYPTAMVLHRLAAKFLGMSLVLPAILMLARRGGGGIMQVRPWETPLALLGVGALTASIFAPLGAIALLLMFPAFALIGVRLGPKVVTLALGLTCTVLLATGLWWPLPAFASALGDGGLRVTAMQLYLASLFGTGISTALMATHYQRLRRLMATRAMRYRQARDHAQAASVAKTDFLATMSHEIRTPLNSIIGFAQLLGRREDLGVEGRHQVDLIRRSGDALLTVVNDILDFSKVEAGRLHLDPKPTDVAQVCQDALSIVAELAERKGLTLSMATEGDLAAAHLCDDHRLCQVLLNFLNNAVKFTDSGGVALTLSVEPDGEVDRVRITVADTGVGISPEAQAGLFQRFSQGDSSVSRQYGGTGLGLAICKGLIEAMNGQVGVLSRPGEGSTFWLEVRLPRAAGGVPQEAKQRAADALYGHVLLVDDHPVNRELGVAILGMLGFTSDIACDGGEAIAAAQRRAYDAILMDVHMPGVDGLAATRAIRALDGAAGRTPIIAMSADVLPEQIDRMYAAGMVDSIAKPVRVEDLHAGLARWIGRDATGGPLPARV
jgi:signal transduction histidine kinase/ActR/RegA family two-component response regulator